MELVRPIRWLALALPVALAAATTLARPAPPGALAAAAPIGDRGCPPGGSAAISSGAAAWYRLDDVLDATGSLSGRQLTAGRASARWTAALPPESFASGPNSGRIVVGDDDGTRSRLRVLDTRLGCWSDVGTTTDVVRSALLGRDGTMLYEHRLDRTTRRDLGVWARATGRPADARLFLPGLGPDAAVGPTFSTTLLPASDGRLIVSSCGERVCRTRIVDPATGRARTATGTGPAAGAVGDTIVAFDACAGLPCAVVRIDLGSGAVVRVGESTGPTAVVVDGDLVVAGRSGLDVADLVAARSARSVPASAGLAPVLATSTAESGIETPAGRVAVAPGGRVDDPSSVRFLDPAALQLTTGEVLP